MQDTQTVELVDNELRAFLADMARLGQNTDSLRISIGPRGLRLQVDGGRWTPACGHVEIDEATRVADLNELDRNAPTEDEIAAMEYAGDEQPEPMSAYDMDPDVEDDDADSDGGR